MATPDSTTFPKYCPKCKTNYPDADKAFSKSKSRKDGFCDRCKACVRDSRRKREGTPRERFMYERLQKTSPGMKICTKCGKELPATTEYFHRHIHGRHGLQSACRVCVLKSNGDWRKENRDRDHEVKQRWQKEHPEQRRVSNHNRRARNHNAEGTHTAEDITAQLKRQRGQCYYCNKKVGKQFHVDHVVPLVRGGRNSPDNLVISCPVCNDKKGCKLPHEWSEGGRLL